MEKELPELNTVIRTFANEGEAHVAQAVLDANGIDSNLIRDDASGMMPWLQWPDIRLADDAQAVLDASGIDSSLIRDDAGGMMPWLQWLHPIRLVVREADSITAVELLDSPPGVE